MARAVASGRAGAMLPRRARRGARQCGESSAACLAPRAQFAPLLPRQVEREFHGLLRKGAKLLAAGTARRAPRTLLRLGYTPKHRIDLYDTTFYLTNLRQIPDIRYFVTYVVRPPPGARAPEIHPRIFYKDVSLVWRAASHLLRSPEGIWIGKGEVRSFVEGGEEILGSVEATTDLPLEMQTALESLIGRSPRVRRDERALDLVLRRGAPGRIEPFRDFMDPRRRARADRRCLVNGGRPVARFTRKDDPGSLVFAPGYEPDFEGGIVERSLSRSKLYGGRVCRFRILSKNREIQFLFFAGPRQVWLAPPQSTRPELTSFGVRPVDVNAPEDLSLPGYEYHFYDESQASPVLVSQIPPGYAGPPSEVDPFRADTSPWLERLPVVRAFRREVLGEG
jgi:hypothetical protein